MIGPSLKFPAERVVELEAELKEIRHAFEQYIANSKELEAGLDKELKDLHGRLKNSTAANNMLAHQLQEMHPVIGQLEKSLSDSKARLIEETKLRLEAEKAKVEIESRCQEIEGNMSHLRQENECLREECEVIQYDLDERGNEIVELRLEATQRDTKLRETLEDARPGTVSRAANPNPNDSYGAILDELEGVTEELLQTQHRLWKAEDELRESQSRVRILEESVKQREIRGGSKSLIDLMDDETFDATISSNEQKLSEELERVTAELAEAQKQLRVTRDRQQEDTSVNETSSAQLQSQIKEKDKELKEFKEQNALLVEEVSCLRDVLHEHNARFMNETKQNAELRSKEINALREKLKGIVRENASLKEQVNRLENGLPASRSDDVARLKKEILQLQASLEQAEKQKIELLQENDIQMHLKMEKLREDLLEEKDREISELREELLEDKKLAETTLEERVEQLADEKFGLEEQMEQIKDEFERRRKENELLTSRITTTAENLKAAKDEIVALKKKTGILSADLEYAKQNLAKIEFQRNKTRDQYSDACAELEIARQILDEAGLDGEMIAREDEKELKQQIHSLSKALEQARQDYAELENDFLDNQHHFCDSQEEASRKAADEIDYLSGKVAEMEAALEAARMENSELSSKLQDARKKSHLSAKQGEKEGRESTMRAIKSEKLQDLRPSYSDELEELDNLQSQLGEMMKALDKVHRELRESKAQLESSENENSKLKQEIILLEKKNSRGVHIVDKSFLSKPGVAEGGTDNEGYEIVQTLSLEGLPPLSWLARDLLGNAPNVQTPHFSADELKSQLDKATEENELLNAMVAELESSNAASSPSLLDASEVKKIIIELEEALKAHEKTSDELERVSQKLSVTEKNLELARQALEASNDENRDLRSEMQTVNDALSESRRELEELQVTVTKAEEERLMSINSAKEILQLQDQLKVLNEEKAALQHQFDDSKIALSMSQYAQERCKDDLRANEAKLSSSTEEICKLKHELTSMSRTLTSLKRAYEDVCEELRHELSKNNDRLHGPMHSLTLQLKELEEENGSLQQLVNELKEALELAQNEIDKKSKQVDVLHHSLVTTQQETRLLTDEITSLTSAFEVSMSEYNNVVKELEELRQAFEPARREVKWNARREMISEIREQLEVDSEQESRAIKEDMENVPKVAEH